MMALARRPLVKICGITSPEDGVAAAELGADLIGLNFWPPSPRAIDAARAKAITEAVVHAVGSRVKVVGVFVNQSPAEIEAIDTAVGLDLIQLHGDESEDEVGLWGGRAIKAFRGLGPLAGVEKTTLARYPRAWGFVVDADAGSAYGGTGRSWAYDRLAPVVEAAVDRPVLVAGGVGPGTARAALAASGARGIDSCSCLESAPGKKDVDRMRQLLREVHDG